MREILYEPGKPIRRSKGAAGNPKEILKSSTYKQRKGERGASVQTN
jgi:hypothetical protein